jgi:hypothetical protein
MGPFCNGIDQLVLYFKQPESKGLKDLVDLLFPHTVSYCPMMSIEGNLRATAGKNWLNRQPQGARSSVSVFEQKTEVLRQRRLPGKERVHCEREKKKVVSEGGKHIRHSYVR